MYSYFSNYILKLLLFFSALLLSLFIAEGAVRLFAPQQLVRSYVRPDPDLGNASKPNQEYFDKYGLPIYSFHISTNNHGMRMNEEVMNSSDIHKLILLGDSFTFGWGVELELSYYHILKSHIIKHYPNIQLLNAGFGGYSTGHILKLLDNYSKKIEISGAIYFMNPNDLNDNISTNPNYQVTSFHESENGTIILEDTHVYNKFRIFLLSKTPYGWLNQNSHLFIITKSAVNFALNGGRPTNQPKNIVNIGKFSEKKKNLMQEVSLAHLERLSQFCKDQNIPLIVIWIPDQSEIFDDFQNKSRDVYATFKQRVLINDIVQNESIIFIDPTKKLISLKRDKKSSDIYFPDGHYNENGNRLISESIIKDLLKHISIFMEKS